MQISDAGDHSFLTLNFSVQTIREKQFTCWSKAQSQFLKSANGGRLACSGRTPSSSRRRKNESRKNRRLRWRGLNRASNSTEVKTRVVVRRKWLLAAQMSSATSKTWPTCRSRMRSKSLQLILMKTRAINRWKKTRTPTKTLLASWSGPNAKKASRVSDVHPAEQCPSMLFWCSVPLRSFFWYQHLFLVWIDCLFFIISVNVKISLLNIRRNYWTPFISNHSQRKQNFNCAIFCSQV